MKTSVQAENTVALLRERLEALAAQLAELEGLREWVGREEKLRRKTAQGGAVTVTESGPHVGAPASHRQPSCCAAYSQQVGLL